MTAATTGPASPTPSAPRASCPSASATATSASGPSTATSLRVRDRRVRATSRAMFDIELGEGQRLAARADGPRRAGHRARRACPGARGRAAAAGDRRHRDRQRGDRGRRPDRRPALPDDVGRHHPARRSAAAGHRGRLGRPRHPRDRRGAMSPPGPCRATSSCGAGTLRALALTTTSGDVAVAGRLAGSGPFGIETVSGDVQLAPAAGDVRVEMATMSGDISSELDGQIEGSRGHRSIVIGSAGAAGHRPVDVRRPEPRPPGPGPRASSAGPPALPRSSLRRPRPTDRAARAAAGGGPEPAPPRNGAIAAAYEDARLGILRVRSSEARSTSPKPERRFEALDGGEPLGDGRGGATSRRPGVPRPGRR